MKKQVFSVLIVGLLGSSFVGCGSDDIIKVDKPNYSGKSDDKIKKSLSITEDKDNVIHIKWDLSNTSGYGLKLTYESIKKGIAVGLSHQVLDMTCSPISSTTTSISYECKHKGKSDVAAQFVVYDGIDYNFRIESLGTNSFGTSQWVLSDPVATLTMQGLK